jgi:hypothetical protein
MKKSYIPFLAFLILLVLTIPFPFHFAASVIPGWHTIIFPTYLVRTIIVVIILILATFAYWLLSKRVDKTNWTIFIIHFLATIPTVMFIKFPFMLLNAQHASHAELLRNISIRIKLIPIAYWIFIAGQILFLIYFIRTITAKRIIT